MLNVHLFPDGNVGQGNVPRKEISEFNQETESWTLIGTMKEPRNGPSVSLVSFQDYKNWCN